MSREEWARRFLEAVQVAGEELDQLALAVAEAMGLGAAPKTGAEG